MRFSVNAVGGLWVSECDVGMGWQCRRIEDANSSPSGTDSCCSSWRGCWQLLRLEIWELAPVESWRLEASVAVVPRFWTTLAQSGDES
ncbi:hypothetical protein V6N13_014352 [Hibiscus sabdariffa]